MFLLLLTSMLEVLIEFQGRGENIIKQLGFSKSLVSRTSFFSNSGHMGFFVVRCVAVTRTVWFLIQRGFSYSAGSCTAWVLVLVQRGYSYIAGYCTAGFLVQQGYSYSAVTCAAVSHTARFSYSGVTRTADSRTALIPNTQQ
jgi:hypothetical protein